VLNNDTIVTEGWLGGLLDVLGAHPDAGIVGPVTNYASGPQVLPDATYGSVAEMERFAAARAAEHAEESVAARRLVGFCWAMRREVLESIGGFDERFGSGNCEDDDYCLRAAQHGWKTRIASGVFVHHAGSRTFRGEGIDYRASLERNFGIFRAKWGLDPAARADQPYPFERLAAGERRPFVPLPSLAGTHVATREGRWFEDAAIVPAPELPGRPPAPATGAASRHRLVVGVLGDGEPGPGPRDLLARHGHAGEPPRWRTTADVAERLRQGGRVLLLGPDVVVPEEALRELVAVATSDPRLAAVGPVAAAAPSTQRGGPPGARAAEADRIARKRRRRDAGRWDEVPHLGGFCLLLDAAACAAAGGLDESRPLADALLELFGKLRASGALVARARGAWVHHEHLDEIEGRGYDTRVEALAQR